MTPTNILCPVDFSDTSRHAIDHAVVVAGYYTSRITALHVLASQALITSRVATPAEEVIELDRLHRQIQEEFAAAIRRKLIVDVLTNFGEPADVIINSAASLSADLIVMGTHGTSGFQRLILGSVTEKVLRKASCPVLTVPPKAHATSRMPFTRVLCPVDFSDASLSAVHTASSLARESGAALTLLHVLEWPREEPPSPMIAELPYEQGFALGEFRRYLEESTSKRLESLITDSPPVAQVVTRLRNGKAYLQILHVAGEEHADLIVLGVHGRNPVDMALFGSTTNQVVRRATCPVLTVRS